MKQTNKILLVNLLAAKGGPKRLMLTEKERTKGRSKIFRTRSCRRDLLAVFCGSSYA